MKFPKKTKRRLRGVRARIVRKAKSFPLHSTIARTRPQKSGRTIVRARRVKPPALFVLIPQEHTWSSPKYVKARLVNKRGYAYLVWRDGKRIREIYIGKAGKSCPTRRRRRPAVLRGPGPGSRAEVVGENKIASRGEFRQGD